MAFIDNEDVFSDAQVITASAKSTHKKNLRAIRKIGVGGPKVFAVVQVVEAMTDASSDSTVAVSIESDDAEAMSSPTLRQALGTFPALSAVGARFVVPLTDKISPEQWIQFDYTVANGNLSTGKFTAFLTTNPPGQWEALPQGSTGPVFA
jgi:hypothetical protein